MGRRRHHEEHVNHEAWAIPYGDLLTLLLAFFVVMYAISSINEGKYRVVADALSSAFGGPPRSISPIQLGSTQLRGAAFDRPSMVTAGAKAGPSAASPVSQPLARQLLDMPTFGREGKAAAAESLEAARARGEQQLNALGQRIQDALSDLVRQKLVTVRRGRTFIEVEIQSDILFASGVAVPSPVATATVRKLGAVLRGEPNALRVEGYTDDQPIRTAQFPSNWELSAARAAGVVHVLATEGVAPGRMAVVGYGEHQPVADNATREGRNANRRVLLVILATPQGPDSVPDTGPAVALAAPPPDDSTAAGAASSPSPRTAQGTAAPRALSAAQSAPAAGAG